jgi:hypothetical protein
MVEHAETYPAIRIAGRHLRPARTDAVQSVENAILVHIFFGIHYMVTIDVPAIQTGRPVRAIRTWRALWSDRAICAVRTWRAWRALWPDRAI